MALEAFKMAHTSQSKLIAISSNPKTIILLIVRSDGYPEVIFFLLRVYLDFPQYYLLSIAPFQA